jgi:conjugal transfer mating pair stabilization protein TraN
MRKILTLLCAGLLWAGASQSATAQSATGQTTADAKADGKAFGNSVIDQVKSAATTAPDASRVPGFNPAATQSLEDLADNPDRIGGAARSAASSNTAVRTIEDSMNNRARFSPQEIKSILARSGEISETPLDYTSGMSVSGSKGNCVPLPPGTGSVGTYVATCNTGYTAEQKSASCSITLEASATPHEVYGYYCVGGSGVDPASIYACNHYPAPQCTITQSWPINLCDPYLGIYWGCSYGDLHVDLVSCTAPVDGATPYTTTTETVVTTQHNESQCSGLAGDTNCSLDNEVCTDSDPVTRIVDGVSVTQPCWAWQRNYTCSARVAGNDCSELEANGSCRFVREDCLTGDSPCSTAERVYECPVPPSETSGQQYVCDGDVYCIDGSCETITREANDEFKDAVVALNAMDQARREFDPETMTLFKGERETCSSKVFGVLNCCKGKGFPLIPGVQLLVALGCSREEILLHERDAQGLCAYVGTYCSSSFLGVCLTKKKVYCCFESKLTRILQEQGRAQLPKPWGKPKSEQCLGFTLDEFARLDLSRMDFSEVYAEFTDAARLPDELQTSELIQQKIRDYYERSNP